MSSSSLIRLVGGPRRLDGTVVDLERSDHDRADAVDGRFVRAARDSTVTSLTSLRVRCTGRTAAEELAATWRGLVFAPSGRARRARRGRARVYRYRGAHVLEPQRDAEGRWTLALGAHLAGGTPPPPPGAPATWVALEHAVDDAAARFATVAALLPDGPLADRASGTRAAVTSCVADAARLCAVGSTVAPHLDLAAADAGRATPPATTTAALVGQVEALVRTIDEATAHLVALHLEVGSAADPVAPLAPLPGAWAELDWPG
jgi:hypothetical protein